MGDTCSSRKEPCVLGCISLEWSPYLSELGVGSEIIVFLQRPQALDLLVVNQIFFSRFFFNQCFFICCLFLILFPEIGFKKIFF